MTKIFTDREDEQSLWLLIERANRLLEKEIASLLGLLDLTIELMKVLYLVDDCEGATLGDLQAASDMDPERVAAAVRALQMRGILTRPRPKEAPEETVIRFTTEGRQKARRAHVAIERFQQRAGGWQGAHREPLLAGLRRLALLPPLAAD